MARHGRQLGRLRDLWRRSRERCDATLEAFADQRMPPEGFDGWALQWARERGGELAGELSATIGVVAITGEYEPVRAEMLRRAGFTAIEGYPAMPLILPLRAVAPDEVAGAGGKGANLAALVRAGLPVPPGFVVYAEAYRCVVAANDLQDAIE